MVTYTRPEWVKPGQQWSAGQTLEEYKTAGGIVNGEFKINEQEVKQLDTTNANGFLEKQRAESLAEEERAKKRKEEEEARYKAEKKTLWDKLLGKQTVEEKQKAEYEELGYEPAEYIKERKADIADLEGMWTSYNKKESERDAAIARQEGRPGADIAFQNREVQNITNKYNIEINRIAAKINTKSAIMAQKQGLMNEAKAFVKEAVDAYTYDLQLAYTQFDKFEEDNRDLLEEIGQEYKDALAETKEINYKIYEEAKTEKTNVMNLMLDTPAAGITIDDTLEEAIGKASEYKKTAPDVTTQIIGSAETGYQTVTIDKKTGKVVSTEPITGIPTGVIEGAEQEIDIYARQLRAGAILPSNVPSKIRGKVLVRQTEFMIEDLRNDILTAKERNDYGTIDDLKDRLHTTYPELDPIEIDKEIDGLIKEVVPTPLITPEETGEEIREAVPYILPTVKEKYLGPYIKGWETAKGFFKGLFGK